MWELRDFDVWLDRWVMLRSPDQDVINEVLAWIQSRMTDPYWGVKLEPGFPNLWFGRVPNTVRGSTVVTASYFVLEGQVVRCNSIETLNLPV